MTGEKRIIEFYGKECPYCVDIVPAIERLEREDNVKVEKLEVWHNQENKRRMEELKPLFDKYCRWLEVPSFYDPERNRLTCDVETYEQLKEWVFGERSQ